jgi:hypothetical protein
MLRDNYPQFYYYNEDEIDALVSGVSDILTGHTEDLNNPHQVTLEQLGAYSSGQIQDLYVNISGDTMQGDLDINHHDITNLDKLRINASTDDVLLDEHPPQLAALTVSGFISVVGRTRGIFFKTFGETGAYFDYILSSNEDDGRSLLLLTTSGSEQTAIRMYTSGNKIAFDDANLDDIDTANITHTLNVGRDTPLYAVGYTGVANIEGFIATHGIGLNNGFFAIYDDQNLGGMQYYDTDTFIFNYVSGVQKYIAYTQTGLNMRSQRIRSLAVPVEDNDAVRLTDLNTLSGTVVNNYQIFTGHIHDDRYYTDMEVDAFISGQNDLISFLGEEFSGHENNHTNPHVVTRAQLDVYSTGEVNTLLGYYSATGHTHDNR